MDATAGRRRWSDVDVMVEVRRNIGLFWRCTKWVRGKRDGMGALRVCRLSRDIA